MTTESPSAILLVSCPDQKGLVAKLANFIYSNGGNILHADQHRDPEAGLFLSRIEWELEGFNLPRDIIGPAFNAIAQPLGADWQLHFSDTVPRLSIWVSRQDHCLLDLLWRHKAGEFKAEIPFNYQQSSSPAAHCRPVWHCLSPHPGDQGNQG